ncbi:MAG: oxidoreductase [Parcubacteria group bacterium Gr01-1014_8]|nr:MAG: oxidoreductase [Parcubacteria group bacterium Gr01-1014_8]
MTKSRLVLGTTQLGMRYGLNNSIGQPSKEQAFEILDAALEGGIDTFDIAYAYGTAEDVMGEWIESRNVRDRIFVISKMKPHVLNDYPDGTKAVDIVLAEIEKSLKRLRLKKLDGYLLHTPSYVYLAHVIAGLHKAKEQGLVGNIGVSVYDEHEALQGAELALDYIQIPSNVLDQRMEKTVFWELVRKNNVTVFARSPFLQGLLLMEPEHIPPHLAYARPHVEKLRSIAGENNLSPAQAALLFSYIRSKAKHIVFGAESVTQLAENIATTKHAKESAWMEEIDKSFSNIERAVVNPSLWSTIRQ